MSFSDIIGNERVKRILQRALQRERVPNSLLFCGPEGVGKKKTALVLAQALNCERMKDDACGECFPCRAAAENKFPDVQLVPVEKNVIKIDAIRELRDLAYFKPMTGRRRVFIVDEAEKMTEEAANSILKVLEEPPSFTHILLLTSMPELILSTIRSRCQVLTFSPVSKEDIERRLKDRGHPAARARILSLLARGNLETALEWTWEDVEVERRRAWEFFRPLLEEKEGSAFLANFAYGKRSEVKEDLEATLEMFLVFLRDIVLLKTDGDAAGLFNPDLEAELRKSGSRLGLDTILEIQELVGAALTGLKRNLNTSLLASSLYSGIIEKSHE